MREKQSLASRIFLLWLPLIILLIFLLKALAGDALQVQGNQIQRSANGSQRRIRPGSSSAIRQRTTCRG